MSDKETANLLRSLSAAVDFAEGWMASELKHGADPRKAIQLLCRGLSKGLEREANRLGCEVNLQ